ncbi:MAG: 2-isopropylmalate synthase [Clostridiales bacterium]|jgi:2-isopropylmalate synthase|nr:2-isopropylmalate synthase [Clostridiales bacterium]
MAEGTMAQESGKKRRVVVFDTTLRDGEQTPGVSLSLSEKTDIARQLESLGVDVIEAGFPAASMGDFKAVRAVSQNVGCCVAALCRCVEQDVKNGWEALKFAKKPRLHLVIATSAVHMRYKLRLEPGEVLRRAARCVEMAKSLCGDVQFSCEDASRSDPEFLFSVLEAVIDAGATTVNITDTVGYSVPEEFGGLIRRVAQCVPNISRAVISAHCHNDLGLAVANTLAAVAAGAGQIEATVNGIGERAGNCSLEEAIMALGVRAGVFGVSHGIDTARIYRASQRVSSLTGIPVHVCKPIVGANAFTHESGIHQHGVLANPLTYEIINPRSVGITERTMTLGKLSGRHALAERLATLGYSLSDAETDSAFARFKELADRKKDVSDEDIEALVNNLGDACDYYRLDGFQIQSGNRIKAMASVTLVFDGRSVTEAALGDGPIDAAFNAVSRAAGGEWPLVTYGIKAVTGGMDALGEVIVRVRRGGELHTGRGLSTDIIEASIMAYISAINRATAKEAAAEDAGGTKE